MISRRLDVESWDTTSIRDDYDLAIATLGYEQRASHIWAKYQPGAKTRIALGFPDNHVLSYPKNVTFYETHGFRIVSGADSECRSQLDAFDFLVPKEAHVIVDISSLTRTRIGLICEWLCERLKDRVLHVDFVYTMAKFQPGGEAIKQNSYAGPVTPAFAGWWRYPELPVAAVIGVGRQQYKALGAVELLQVPESIWTFLPLSIEAQYGEELQHANKELFKRVPVNQRIDYNVGDPLATFSMLRSLVETLAHSYNVVLLPFGPKMFSLLALLVPLTGVSAAVWRISAGSQQPPSEALPRDEVVGLRVTFHPFIAE